LDACIFSFPNAILHKLYKNYKFWIFSIILSKLINLTILTLKVPQELTLCIGFDYTP